MGTYFGELNVALANLVATGPNLRTAEFTILVDRTLDAFDYLGEALCTRDCLCAQYSALETASDVFIALETASVASLSQEHLQNTGVILNNRGHLVLSQRSCNSDPKPLAMSAKKL